MCVIRRKKKRCTSAIVSPNCRKDTYNVSFIGKLCFPEVLQKISKDNLYIKIETNFKYFYNNTQSEFHLSILETIFVLEILNPRNQIHSNDKFQKFNPVH